MPPSKTRLPFKVSWTRRSFGVRHHDRKGGVGMWSSTIYRNVPLPNGPPLAAIFRLTSCTVHNFALDSNAKGRDSIDGAGGAMGTTGDNWLADGIWTQHTLSGFWASGTGGTVQNCRIASVWGDGINLNNVALDGPVGNTLVARNNFVRARETTLSLSTASTTTGTLITNQLPNPQQHVQGHWGGNGLGVGKFGVNGASATATENLIERSGGNGYLQQQAALHISSGGDGQNLGTVTDARISGKTINKTLSAASPQAIAPC